MIYQKINLSGSEVHIKIIILRNITKYLLDELDYSWSRRDFDPICQTTLYKSF